MKSKIRKFLSVTITKIVCKKFSILLIASIILFACGEKKAETSVTEVAASPVKTTSLKVWGNCETCKDNIEGSLKVEGISKADWNVETKMLSVTYDSTKIKLDQIEKDIAAAGYDNDAYKGDDKAYADLAPCCQYDRK